MIHWEVDFIASKVNNGSVYGLVPPGTKPLPKPMLTKISDKSLHYAGTMR